MSETIPSPPVSWADVERRRLPGSVVLEQLEDAFEAAAGRCGRVTRRFCIAGRDVDLEFAGTALVAKLTAAFHHLKTNDAAPSTLSIRVWDGSTTGVAPRLPRRPSAGLGLQRVVAGSGSVRRFYSELSRALYCFDVARRRAFVWFEDDSVPSWDIGAPFRPVLAWWAESIGAQLAHGAVIGTSGAAVLLAGKGGSGKSTTAVSSFRAGLSIAGDDYVIIEASAPDIAHSLYCTVKLTQAELERRFPELTEYAISKLSATDKRVLALRHAGPGAVVERLPIRAVAAHAVSPNGEASLRRASAVEVLAALAPSSLFQLPGPEVQGLERLGRTVRVARTFALRAGSDSAENVALVRRMLAESHG